jgi:hypothetical protein
MTLKQNPVTRFLKRFFDKLDQQMLEKAKAKPCCQKNKPKDKTCSK